jgi:hypothetical protein
MEIKLECPQFEPGLISSPIRVNAFKFQKYSFLKGKKGDRNKYRGSEFEIQHNTHAWQYCNKNPFVQLIYANKNSLNKKNFRATQISINTKP